MINENCKIALIVHNVRSAHNVGSILRSADGFGVSHVYFSGYTPYPSQKKDERLPHLRAKIDKQIHKTALGAENSVTGEHFPEIESLIQKLRAEDFIIAALEQTPNSTKLNNFKPKQNIALIVGNELDGIDQKTLELCDFTLEIPMQGKKESLNVAVAAAVAMYQLRFSPF